MSSGKKKNYTSSLLNSNLICVSRRVLGPVNRSLTWINILVHTAIYQGDSTFGAWQSDFWGSLGMLAPKGH